MSHANLLVRLPARLKPSTIGKAIAELMLPYKETFDRTDPLGSAKKYREFVDHEDEYRKEYETDGHEKVKMPDGRLLLPWNEEFRVPGSIGIGGDSHVVPTHLERVQVAFQTEFATFEIFMKEWCEEDRDEKMNRYGRWRNPNAKWDWWVIGGRWRDKLPVEFGAERFVANPAEGDSHSLVRAEKWDARVLPEWKKRGTGPGADYYRNPPAAGRADCCRIEHLDWQVIADETAKHRDAFLAEWDAFLSGKEFGPFDGPRDRAIEIGWLECLNANEMPANPHWKQKWTRRLDPEQDRFDVVREKPDLSSWQEGARLQAAFSQISTFARLDDNGWTEKGRMGWFGMHDGSPQSATAHALTQEKWLAKGDQSDWVVLCDYHI